MSFFWSSEIKIKPASEAKAEVQEFHKKRMGIQQQIIKAVANVLNGKINKAAIKGETQCSLTTTEIKELCPNEHTSLFNITDYRTMLKEVAQKYGEAGYNFAGFVNNEIESDTLVLRWNVDMVEEEGNSTKPN
jgi:outer membrane protein assembly factor BamA